VGEPVRADCEPDEPAPQAATAAGSRATSPASRRERGFMGRGLSSGCRAPGRRAPACDPDVWRTQTSPALGGQRSRDGRPGTRAAVETSRPPATQLAHERNDRPAAGKRSVKQCRSPSAPAAAGAGAEGAMGSSDGCGARPHRPETRVRRVVGMLGTTAASLILSRGPGGFRLRRVSASKSAERRAADRSSALAKEVSHVLPDQTGAGEEAFTQATTWWRTWPCSVPMRGSLSRVASGGSDGRGAAAGPQHAVEAGASRPCSSRPPADPRRCARDKPGSPSQLGPPGAGLHARRQVEAVDQEGAPADTVHGERPARSGTEP